MASPTVTARIQPTAIRLDDGHGSVVAFADDPDLEVYEVSVTPGAVDGGEEIVTTSHHNDTYTTKSPQHLIDNEPTVMECSYDPGKRSAIEARINDPGSITQAWPDGSYKAFWGYLKRAEFGPLVKGQQPRVTLTIVETDYDPVNCVEAGPVFFDGTGSC